MSSQDTPRLIEHAFPLKQTSLDSVHEKNVRHGHISTLHIWPARRPLAACRAALIATLLPDPSAQPRPEGMPDDQWQKEIIRRRQELCEKIGGRVVKKLEKKKMPNGQVVEREKEVTEGGILHWGRESENKADLEWFRQEIRRAYGGRAPKVLDPFAGGGAIPLEAMRLGCEATAVDINPVAWFILKCTLEYPQKLAGKTLPLPGFILENEEFMEAFYKAHPHLVGRTKKTKKQKEQEAQAPNMFDRPDSGRVPKADLAWQVRAWGQWVLEQARRELARFYPIYADFEPLDKRAPKPFEPQPMRLVPMKEDGTPDIAKLNGEFSAEYLNDKRNPRWIAKPTVAYLWARTVRCKNCRATVPLLKTRWLCKKDKKRVLLDLTPDPSPQGGEGRIPGYVYELCRKLRVEQTPAEQILWEALRDRRLGGFKFRRQHPLGRYIADFYCADASLVIELDGPIHHRPDQKEYDQIREEQFKARNLRVIRFSNHDVENNLEITLQSILYLTPRTPSPRVERGRLVPHIPSSPMERGQGVRFFIQTDVPVVGGNTAQRREHDKRIGMGTMSRSGAKCPCCGTIMTMEDIRLEGQAGRLGAVSTAVVVDGQKGKEYRLPTGHEGEVGKVAEEELQRVFGEIPFGIPEENTPVGGSRQGGGSPFTVYIYGLTKWRSLFTTRQLLALGVFVKWTRVAREELGKQGYQAEWVESIVAYLAILNDKVADYNSKVCVWHISGELIGHTFTRFALPITWDYTELAVINDVGGAFSAQLDWMSRYVQHALTAGAGAECPLVQNRSAIETTVGNYDAIVTDPPYYDAIPYSDLMDFFYLWLRRTLNGLSPELDSALKEPLSPKWNHEQNDGELIDDSSRHGGDKHKSKAVYEDGMARVFQACHKVLKPDGKVVVVFAHKHPDAWETLVSAIIRAGFVVDGSWPIQTEMSTRMRAKSSAALSSSVWLVCKKRPPSARPGWDTQVLEAMHQNIRRKLREFWDAGIRGPDFVWTATGPALEAYSRHPVVRKANEPGPLTVTEFLTQVRRMVVDFVVGRVLSGEEEGGAELAAADRLDEPTAYYLLHRHDFGLDEAPAGACILYAVSCGLSDRELAGAWDLIGFAKGKSSDADEGEEEDADAEAEVEEDSGSKIKLKTWAQRKGRSLGYEAPGGRPIPLIDRVHCLMHLWKAGDLHKVDEYLNDNGLRRQELFKRLLQSLIELSPQGSEERSLLESLSNHVQGRGAVRDDQVRLVFEREG